MFFNSPVGLRTTSLSIKKPKLNIYENYNDDFPPIHELILNRLSQENDSGIVLLHGQPGTGKTTYIRYLANIMEKIIIFLPSNMVKGITYPNMLETLMENRNSIFVIEDAEEIIIDRGHISSSPISTLLNITDGLLSDYLSIQIICSFNTNLTNIDPAFLRKGRLIAKYEFKALEVEKAQNLSNKLGFQTKIEEPMILSDIYNQNDQSFDNKKQNNLGFVVG